MSTTTMDSTGGTAAGEVSLSQYNEEQVKLMDEVCIVVDENDKAVREGTKKECHLMSNINEGLLHRAFSVFLFNPATGALLLQKRAPQKITFPSMWTNTCCSHPLAGDYGLGDERVEEGELGVRRAVRRKLEHELGIKLDKTWEQKMLYLTRIHYKAPSDGLWGEHEVDYIFFITVDPTVVPNNNEVEDIRWVGPNQLKEMFKDPTNGFTPWFQLIVEQFLFKWWEELVTRSASRTSCPVPSFLTIAPSLSGSSSSLLSLGKPEKDDSKRTGELGFQLNVEVLKDLVEKDKVHKMIKE